MSDKELQAVIEDVTNAAIVYKRTQSVYGDLTRQIKSYLRVVGYEMTGTPKNWGIQKMQKSKKSGTDGQHARASLTVHAVGDRLSEESVKRAMQEFVELRNGIESPLKMSEKRLNKIASMLPCADWIADEVPGVAHGLLGQIVAETGDLRSYSTPAKLWKRMGLGLVRGYRQQKWSDTRTGYTKKENKEIAIEMGYNPKRRSLMWNLGECLIKNNYRDTGETTTAEDGKVKKVREPLYYRRVYNERLAYKLAQHGVDPSSIDDKFKKTQEYHQAKADAHRYMEKRFLLHLWQRWQRSFGNENV